MIELLVQKKDEVKMNIIRYKPVKEKLSNRTLSDKQALPYLIMFFMFSIVPIFSSRSTQMNKYDYIVAFVNILFSVFGTLYLFKKNGGSKGNDFILKYIVLSWILGVRSLFIVVPLYFFYRGFMHRHYSNITYTTQFSVGAVIVYLFLFCYRLGVHIKSTTHDNNVT